jgi:raffinose/stachyose/melibiose transport system substrate-binding protein
MHKFLRSARTALIPLALAMVATGVAGCSGGGGDGDNGGGDGDTVNLVFASWRTEDISVWEDTIIPVFEASHPGITIEFNAINTNDYNAAVQSQMEGQTGPDLILCRPFDVNRSWISQGYFDSLADFAPISHFSEADLAAWTGPDGTPYCLPIASVLAGFFYNKAIFAELGLTVPTTQAEFIAVLEAVKADGRYTPLAFGSADGWQMAYNGWYSIGPAYWHGEEGRLGLIDGTAKLTDPEFVASLEAFMAWKDYLPQGQEALTYSDMAQLFSLGQAAIIPDGSWDINQVTAGGVDTGVFGPPVPSAGDQRYLQQMPDMGVGINAAGSHKAEALQFLEWLATPEFLNLYVNAAAGFFAMGDIDVTYSDPLAQAFADLKAGAELTPRLALDRLSAGTPPLDDEVWRVLQVLYTSDSLTVPAALAELQAGLDSWYTPAG